MTLVSRLLVLTVSEKNSVKTDPSMSKLKDSSTGSILSSVNTDTGMLSSISIGTTKFSFMSCTVVFVIEI